MGNYSYLKKVLFGKETRIDFEKLKQELNKIDTEKELDPYYLRCLGQDIENFEDYANRIDGDKFCGYLTAGTVKKLCKSGRCMTAGANINPIMYFEEEGWDRLHYFKFFPGTETVEHGVHAFNFDEELYENKFNKNLPAFKKVINELKNKFKIDDNDDDMHEYVTEKRDDYITNLINDTSTNWERYFLNYK
jgi:hypothetical protein